MSYWNREFDNRERPDYSPLDRYVCPTCITDSYLANVVSAEIDEEEPCSYCGARGAAHISTICDVISEAIARHYVDPAEDSRMTAAREDIRERFSPARKSLRKSSTLGLPATSCWTKSQWRSPRGFGADATTLA
jgi:hypothetical protein